MSDPVITRQGCRVAVERVGPSVGVTVTQRDGRSATYALGADEAWRVAQALLTVSLPPEDDGPLPEPLA